MAGEFTYIPYDATNNFKLTHPIASLSLVLNT